MSATVEISDVESPDAGKESHADLLRCEFEDPFYRKVYCEDYLDSRIATQLVVLREQRGLTQKALAELAKMHQSRIATMEDVNYSRWSVSTLKRLADAFGLCLKVEFVTPDEMIEDMEKFSREYLQKPESAAASAAPAPTA